jgi:hypothetical protein
MTATNEFFIWFYYGLGGLGGWFLFFVVSLAAVAWVLYDSSVRRLPVIGWRMGVILTAAMLLPAILFRFTVTNVFDVTQPLAPYSEPIFYLGMLGGVLPAVLAVGYYLTYQGMQGCVEGHVYEAHLGQCPVCARNAPAPVVVQQSPPRAAAPAKQRAPSQPLRDVKPKAQAWLVSVDTGRDYQLNLGETSIGRLSSNDVYLLGDRTVSRQHAKILESNGHFKLMHISGSSKTMVNGKSVREPQLLEHDDEIQFGKGTVMRFITSRR